MDSGKIAYEARFADSGTHACDPWDRLSAQGRKVWQNVEEAVRVHLMKPVPGWREQDEKDPHGHRYDCTREQLAGGHFTDDQVAFAVGMTGRRDLDFEGVICMAKDRIRWLSRQLHAAQKAPPANTAAQILLTPEGGGMRGPMSDYTRTALRRLASCAEAAVATDGKCVAEWLSADAENARSNDPEVGIFGNEDMACLFEALDGLVEAVGPMGTTIARELRDLASLAPKTSVPGNDAGMREAALERWWNAGGIERHNAQPAFRAGWGAALDTLSPPTGSAGDDETGAREALKWKCRACGAESDEPDNAFIRHPAGYGYRAPCCGPCGQYFSAEDIAEHEPQVAHQPPKAETPAGVGEREAFLAGVQWVRAHINGVFRADNCEEAADEHALVTSRLAALSLAPAARAGGGVEAKAIAITPAMLSAASKAIRSVEIHSNQMFGGMSLPARVTDRFAEVALNAALIAAPAANGEGA